MSKSQRESLAGLAPKLVLGGVIALAIICGGGCGTPAKQVPDSPIRPEKPAPAVEVSAAAMPAIPAKDPTPQPVPSRSVAPATRQPYYLPHGFAPTEAEQDAIYEEFLTTEDQALKDTDAYILSTLWHKGTLKEEIRDKLLDSHLKLVLYQEPNSKGAPTLVVRAFLDFPFPQDWVTYTATPYVNDRILPSARSVSDSMSRNGLEIVRRSPRGSDDGVALKDGDEFWYQVKVESYEKKERYWARFVTTNVLEIGELETEPDPRVLYSTYRTTEHELTKTVFGFELARLWLEGLLPDEIRDEIIDRRYRAVLFQDARGYTAMNFTVHCFQDFPFPEQWVSFSTELLVDGEHNSSRPFSKATSLSYNNMGLAGITGRKFEDGDSLQYEIIISYGDKERPTWARRIRTNTISVVDPPDPAPDK